MMIERHRTLCQQIIDHCRQQQWYGPDGSLQYRDYTEERGYINEQGKLQKASLVFKRFRP